MNHINNPNLNILCSAVNQLGSLIDEVVFVGGCATGLLVTDLAAAPIRMTRDVDVIIQVYSNSDYRSFIKRLKKRGFKEDIRPDAPICRWIGEDVLLDVMPTDETILGFSNYWYLSAFKCAKHVKINGKYEIRLIQVPHFLITKCDAFDGRGKGDFYNSHDIEDIITVLDGCPDIVSNVLHSDNELKEALSTRFNEWLNYQDFLFALPGHLLPDDSSQNRIPLILERMNKIVKICI